MAKNKKVVQRENVTGKKTPVIVEDLNSYYKMTPVWSFRRLDNSYKKWGFVHVDDLNSDVISKLKNYEGMTWGDIINTSGGRNYGNNNMTRFFH